MNKKASVLIISLWIMAILAIFAVSIAHRASINLRLAKYQMSRLKAGYLARAGINRARLVIGLAGTDCHSFGDTWSTGVDPSAVSRKSLLENIELKKDSGETFTVRYLYEYDHKGNPVYKCIEDEGSKLNINILDTPLKIAALEKLLEYVGGMPFQDAIDCRVVLAKWVDPSLSSPAPDEPYDYFKRAGFRVKEEVLPALEYFYATRSKADNPRRSAEELFDKIKNYITVYGQGQINLNTVQKPLWEQFCRAAGELIMNSNPPPPEELNISEFDALGVASDIIALRGSGMVFYSEDLEKFLNLQKKINESRLNNIGLKLDDPAKDPKSAILNYLLAPASFSPATASSSGTSDGQEGEDGGGDPGSGGKEDSDKEKKKTAPAKAASGILSVTTSAFRITSIGTVDKITKTISAVFDGNNIISWREN